MNYITLRPVSREIQKKEPPKKAQNNKIANVAGSV